MGIRSADVKGQKTYWHLMSLGRKPTEYEIVTSRLLYHPQRGFEVNVPVAQWYERYQKGSILQCSDWESFADPRRTTYSSYVTLQSQKEIFVGRLLRSIEQSEHDRHLDESWAARLLAHLCALLHPLHGLQMQAAYSAQMAPSGRIAIAAMFQAADEIRRIERIAFRIRQLQQARPEFAGSAGQQDWEQAAHWQPLREVIERGLVTWDWGAALVMLNFVLKPALDGFLMLDVGRHAQAQRDDPLQRLFLSLHEDCLWHRQWSQALLATALRDTPDQRAALEAVVEQWLPPVTQAITALAEHLEIITEPVEKRVQDNWRQMLAEIEPVTAQPAAMA
jgi:toluene monooxygenase system protein E